MDFGRHLRTWPDDAHIPSEHIDELREFVKAVLPQDAADAGHSRVVLELDRITRRGNEIEALQVGDQSIGTLDHRAELDHLERLAVEPDALAEIEHRPRAAGPDEQSDQEQNRQSAEQDKAREHGVEQSFLEPLGPLVLGLLHVDEGQPGEGPHVQSLTGHVDDAGGNQQVDVHLLQLPGQRRQFRTDQLLARCHRHRLRAGGQYCFDDVGLAAEVPHPARSREYRERLLSTTLHADADDAVLRAGYPGQGSRELPHRATGAHQKKACRAVSAALADRPHREPDRPSAQQKQQDPDRQDEHDMAARQPNVEKDRGDAEDTEHPHGGFEYTAVLLGAGADDARRAGVGDGQSSHPATSQEDPSPPATPRRGDERLAVRQEPDVPMGQLPGRQDDCQHDACGVGEDQPPRVLDGPGSRIAAANRRSQRLLPSRQRPSENGHWLTDSEFAYGKTGLNVRLLRLVDDVKSWREKFTTRSAAPSR